MATLLNPFIRALDANGDPVSGAQLAVFEAGTTTPVTTYSDRALSTAQARPLIANSAGEFAQSFVASGIYKIRVSDADGVTLYENDNVRIADRPDDPVFFDTIALLLESEDTYAAGTFLLTVKEGARYTALASGATNFSDENAGGQKLMRGYQVYDTVADFLDSVEPSRGVGSIWEAGGFRYEEVASDGHVTIAAGVEFEVLPGESGYHVNAFGAAGDNTGDDGPALNAAASAARENGWPITGAGIYRCEETINFRYVEVDMPRASIIGHHSGIICVLGGNSNSKNNPRQSLSYVKDSDDDEDSTTPTVRVIGAKGARISIDECRYFQLYADTDSSAGGDSSSIAYSDFNLGFVSFLELTNNAGTDGSKIQWINENNFYLNRIINLYINGTYTHNHNWFHRGTFEAGAAINIQRGSQNHCIGLRGEGDCTITFGTDANDNTVEYSWVSSNSRWESGPTVADSGRLNVVKHRQHVMSDEATLVGFSYETLKKGSNGYNVIGAEYLDVNATSLSAGTFKYIYTSPMFYSPALVGRFLVNIFDVVSGGVRVSVLGYDENGNQINSTSADVNFDGVGSVGFGDDDVSLNTSTGATFWITNPNTKYIRVRVRTGGVATEFGSFSISALVSDVGIRRQLFASIATTSSANPNYNRTTDGEYATFAYGGTKIGALGVSSEDRVYIADNNMGLLFAGNANALNIVPCDGLGAPTDDVALLGIGEHRFKEIFATDGVTQTSDRNEKQDICELDEAERRAAVAAKGLLKKFRWKSGDTRTHFGIVAQDLRAAFNAEGLDPDDYALISVSTWTDETGTERTRLGVRYSELQAFILAAI